MDEPIAQKSVNALITDAELGFGAKFLVNAADLDVTQTVIEGFNKAIGGLWVGGTAALYEKKLTFRPNALNLAVHAGDYSVEILLAEITDVQVRFGFVTKIIDVTTDHGKLSIRCFGARDFADAIRVRKDSLNDDG